MASWLLGSFIFWRFHFTPIMNHHSSATTFWCSKYPKSPKSTTYYHKDFAASTQSRRSIYSSMQLYSVYWLACCQNLTRNLASDGTSGISLSGAWRLYGLFGCSLFQIAVFKARNFFCRLSSKGCLFGILLQFRWLWASFCLVDSEYWSWKIHLDCCYYVLYPVQYPCQCLPNYHDTR